MAARRCSIHGSFPPETKYLDCPICGEPTRWVNEEEPDPGYADRIAEHMEWKKSAAHEPPEIPCVASTVKVKHEDGTLWVHVWDLYAHGLRDKMDTGDLFQVGQQTFEVLLYVDDRRSYVVRAFSLELSEYELRKLADDVE